MKALFAVLLCSLVSGVAVAQTTFNVSNQGLTAYRINNQNNPLLTLMRGQSYTFNINALGHPFYIKTARVLGTASQYFPGVTGQGEDVGPLTFNVPQDAPNELFYQCGVHSAMGGTIEIMPVLDVPGAGAPGTLWLANAVPNPVREGTVFRFELPRPASIQFILVDTRGRRIRALAIGEWPGGSHLVRWDGRDDGGRRVASGVYFYRLSVEGKTLTRRLSLTR